jgi:hypothetical protein
MAKKKTVGPDTPAAPAPAAPRRRAASSGPRRRAGSANSGAAEPLSTAAPEIDRAAEMSSSPAESAAASAPSYGEIAEAAYHRYLERGGGHGQDFDDWVEAERRLRSRS